MTDCRATTARFVSLVWERCVPAVVGLRMFDTAGLEIADDELSRDFLKGEPGQAYTTPEGDILIYQPKTRTYCGVMSDPVDRASVVSALRDWATTAQPAFVESPPDDPEIQIVMRGEHPRGGNVQLLVSFERDGQSMAHASAAWVRGK